MTEKLRLYVDSLFKDAPQTKKVIELKEEIFQNLIDKYNDLIMEGKSEESAYNIAVASVGDVNELIGELMRNEQVRDVEREAKERQKSAMFVAIAVALYILSPIAVLITGSTAGVVAMLCTAAIATGLLIYNSMTRTKYQKVDDTMVEEFKEWKADQGTKNQAVKAISSALWMLVVCIYFIVSFATHAWYITWIIFLIASAAQGIVKAIFDLRK